MKRVIVAVQNKLVSEVVAYSLKNHNMLVEQTCEHTPQGIVNACETLFADVLVMDVTRFGDGAFSNRLQSVYAVKTAIRKVKICLVCDNVSDADLSVKVANAKTMGVIDAFFYQSVPSDYIADVISTL